MTRLLQQTNLSSYPLHFVRGFEAHINYGQVTGGDDWGPPVPNDPRPIDLIALGDGIVTKYSDNPTAYKGGFGWYLVYQIAPNDLIYYAHTEKGTCLVKVGQKIKKGQHLVNMGNTGWSTGKHVHVGRKKDGKWIDVHDLIIKKTTPMQEKLWKKLEREYPHIELTYNVHTVYNWWVDIGVPLLIQNLQRLADLGDNYAKKALDNFETHDGYGKNTPLGWYVTDTHYKNIWFKSFLPVETK